MCAQKIYKTVRIGWWGWCQSDVRVVIFTAALTLAPRVSPRTWIWASAGYETLRPGREERRGRESPHTQTITTLMQQPLASCAYEEIDKKIEIVEAAIK